MSIEPERTEDSAMSEAVVGSEPQDDTPTKAELAQRVERLEREKDSEIQDLQRSLHEERKRRRELEHDVDFLRDSLFLLQDLVVGEDRMVTMYEDENPPLVDQIEGIKRGEVDTSDLVGGVDPDLPIEEDIAKAGNENLQSDLSANELRAVQIFRAFGGKAKSWSGKMRLDSADVRQILEENGESGVNDNTPRRAMKMLAKKSADLPKKERDPRHEENLMVLARGDKRLELHANKEEWLDYMDGLEDRYSP